MVCRKIFVQAVLNLHSDFVQQAARLDRHPVQQPFYPMQCSHLCMMQSQKLCIVWFESGQMFFGHHPLLLATCCTSPWDLLAREWACCQKFSLILTQGHHLGKYGHCLPMQPICRYDSITQESHLHYFLLESEQQELSQLLIPVNQGSNHYCLGSVQTPSKVVHATRSKRQSNCEQVLFHCDELLITR